MGGQNFSLDGAKLIRKKKVININKNKYNNYIILYSSIQFIFIHLKFDLDLIHD